MRAEMLEEHRYNMDSRAWKRLWTAFQLTSPIIVIFGSDRVNSTITINSLLGTIY